MDMLEPKYRALLEEARRRELPGAEDMRACFELLALAGAIDRACAGRLAPHRLSEGKFVLLFLLHGQSAGLAPHELAGRAGVSRATVTGLLDGLERDDLIARSPHPDDRRKIVARLTDRGRVLAGSLFEEHARWIASLFAGMTPQERQVLDALVRRVRCNAGHSVGNDTGPGPATDMDTGTGRRP